MDLFQILKVLSKSSPYAVTTSGEPVDPIVKDIKQYLYVETEIERAFSERLNSVNPGDIIFLCGSSGDGKSEILSKYQNDFEGRVHFHLDATHSFGPDKTAIEELDDLFSRHQASGQPLVVGINTGMLANYQREGSDQHFKIKEAISRFEKHEYEYDGISFIDFEAFPKFKIENGRVFSDFFSSLLDRVVKDDSKNHFRKFYNLALNDPRLEMLVANFTLLSDRFVQKVIIELLLQARIAKDQFITARMLLDFIYCILTGTSSDGKTGYLFDNLFQGGDNELLVAIKELDPSLKRDMELDAFILNQSLGFNDQALFSFLDECRTKNILIGTPKPNSLIRFFYVLQNSKFQTNYHYKFAQAFNGAYWHEYREIWELHKNYSGEPEQKRKLRKFYDEIVFKAINKYANRNAPYLSKDEFYISSHGGVDLASALDISACYQSVEKNKSSNLAEFNMFLKVGDRNIEAFPVSVNLLELMMKVVSGFRPNKHDKSCIVLLEELVSKIASQAGLSDVLLLYAGEKSKPIKLRHNPSDGEIRVSGL